MTAYPSVTLTPDQAANVDRFVEALQSGRYAQTRGRLRDQNGFCCLGVACDLVDPNGWMPNFDCAPPNTNRYSFFGATTVLSPSVRATYGFPSEQGIEWVDGEDIDGDEVWGSLTSVNDRGETFDQIAQRVREWKSVCTVIPAPTP